MSRDNSTSLLPRRMRQIQGTAGTNRGQRRDKPESRVFCFVPKTAVLSRSATVQLQYWNRYGLRDILSPSEVCIFRTTDDSRFAAQVSHDGTDKRYLGQSKRGSKQVCPTVCPGYSHFQILVNKRDSRGILILWDKDPNFQGMSPAGRQKHGTQKQPLYLFLKIERSCGLSLSGQSLQAAFLFFTQISIAYLKSRSVCPTARDNVRQGAGCGSRSRSDSSAAGRPSFSDNRSPVYHGVHRPQRNTQPHIPPTSRGN